MLFTLVPTLSVEREVPIGAVDERREQPRSDEARETECNADHTDERVDAVPPEVPCRDQ